MNLFEELEGKSGENLCASVLRMLMLRNQSCRAAMLRVVDAASPVGRIDSRSHFSCSTEHPTTDPELGDGRIDLLIEVDAAVVGIEAKFGAPFQKEQPAKYQCEIRRLATQLSEARKHELRSFLIVLAPEARRSEITAIVEEHAELVTWENVIESLEDASALDPVSEVLRNEFVEYLHGKLDFLRNFPAWAHHPVQRWEARGTEEQHQLLRSLVSVLPNPSSRIGAGDTWVGYHFSPEGADGSQAWIGFIPGTRAVPDRPGALLVLTPPHIPEALPPGCQTVRLDPEISIAGAPRPSVEIQFDDGWSSQEKWREVIEALAGPENGSGHASGRATGSDQAPPLRT